MLKLSGLYKTFGRGGPNEVLALRGLDLMVAEGELVTIIGSNGSGKSTLMGCVAGTHLVDAGRVVVGETNVTAWPERQRARLISRVFQDPLSGTCASMTVEENLALAHRRGKSRGLRRGLVKGERELFQDALATIGLGLENRLNDQVALLSGGQRQALTLIMATLVRPTLLLLDEHTAAQDPKTASLTMELTMDLVEQKRLTTLMITHNLTQALEYGQRLVMLHQGRIVLDFSAEAKAKLNVKTLLDHFLAVTAAEGVVGDRQLFSQKA